MEPNNLAEAFQSTLGAQLPSIIGAVAILVVGWLIAFLARAGLAKTLGVAKLNDRVAKTTQSKLDFEYGVAGGVYWVILLLTFIAVFNTLNLELVSQPLNTLVTEVFAYLPRLVAGGLLMLVAWLVAAFARMVISKALSATTWSEKLDAETGVVPVSENLGNLVFWLTILFFLPAVLGAFQLTGLLEPVQAMIEEILAVLPNLLAAILIGFVGWVVAKILRDITANLLAAAGADKLGKRVGFLRKTKLSDFTAGLVFIFIFIPALIAALNALRIEAISGPATDMLSVVLGVIPDIFAAAVILALTYFVARFVADLLKDLLASIGLDTVPDKLGLDHMSKDGFSLSALVGKLLMFFAMLFASVEASNKLGFTQVRDLVTVFIEFGGQILLGSVILAVGVWLANLAYQGITRISSDKTHTMATLARVAILVIVSAMGLRAMGIADDIVNMAFGITLGAVAIAVALSFGLGGREAAGKQMEYWLVKLRNE